MKMPLALSERRRIDDKFKNGAWPITGELRQLPHT